MAKITDNLRKVYRAQINFNGTTTASLEVDLQIPRGYVAKMEKVRFANVNLALIAGDLDWLHLQMALINDPDDAVTVAIPANELHHDAIAMYDGNLYQDITANFATMVEYGVEWNFKDLDMDVIAARPMRFNVDSSNAAVDHLADCIIEYTLEKVTSKEILELLDIL